MATAAQEVVLEAVSKDLILKNPPPEVNHGQIFYSNVGAEKKGLAGVFTFSECNAAKVVCSTNPLET